METTTAGLAAAQLHQQAGDLDSARQEYSRLLEAEPDRVEALHGLGGIAYQQGDHDRAVEWLGRAVAVQPDNPLLHSNLGAAHRAAGRLAEAEACYRQALRLQPDLAQAYNNLANVLKAQGKGEEAAARYWQAVLASPIYAEARHNLGLILWEQGEHEAALDQFRFAVQLRPDFTEAHASAGLLLRELGRSEEAASRLREAVRLRPDGANDHFNLAAILLEQGHAGEAASHFSEAVRLRPDWAEAHRALGVALAALGRPGESAALLGLSRRLQSTGRAGALPPASAVAAPKGDAREPATEAAAAGIGVAFESLRKMKPEEAEALCREALNLKPDRPRVLDALGTALARQGRLTEALTAFHHAIRVEPTFAEAYLHLGGALREQGDLGRAVGYFRHALRLRPGMVEAHHQLGLAFVDLGELEAAADAYREALRLQPDSVFALGHLGSLLEELGEAERGVELLQRALRLGPDEWQTHTHYGASLVNLGRFEEARSHFLRALDLHPGCGPAWFFLARDGGQPLSDADVAYLQALLQREHLVPRDRISVHFALGRVHDRAREFDEAFHHCEQGSACKARLLELRGTAYQEETHARLVDRIVAAFGPAHFERTRSFGIPAEEPVFIVGMPRSGTSLVEQILASHPAVHGAGELRLMQQFVDGLPAELGGASAYPDCMAGLDAEASRRLGEAYVEKLRRLGGGKARISDKMPMNFHHLGVMATLLPRAPIIHCRRDARDVCWSCYFQNFRDIAFACDLRKLGVYHRQYERIMAHWRAVLPVPVLEVQYEELVAEPERVSREIVAFCRLPWHEGCLDFHHTQRVVRTASNMQVRRPVYRSSVGYWRNYEKHLGPLLEALAPQVR